jgi:hypothetical protein
MRAMSLARFAATGVRRGAATGGLVMVLAVAAWPAGADAAPEDEYTRVADALQHGRDDEAIAALEALADRGVVHPDASFDRGIAYARRARGRSAAPGDLGRAAAGFEEALGLRPGDVDAAAALEVVRGEVARRRARRGKDEVSVGDPPDRLVTGLASERTWALLAVVSSLVLAAGLLLRRRGSGPWHVAGSLAVPLGALGLCAFTPAAWWAGVLTRERGVGVVIAPEITLTNDQGQRTDAPVVPEAARVEVGRVADERVRVRWGSYEGWAPLGSVRRIAR